MSGRDRSPRWRRIGSAISNGRLWIANVGIAVVVGYTVIILIRAPDTLGAWWALASVVGIVGGISWLWVDRLSAHRKLPRRIVPRTLVILGRLAVALGLLTFVAGLADAAIYRHDRVVTFTVARHEDTHSSRWGSYRYQIHAVPGGRYSVERPLYDRLVDGREYRCVVRDLGHLELEPSLLVSCVRR